MQLKIKYLPIFLVCLAFSLLAGCAKKADYASIRKIAILEDTRTLGGGMLEEYLKSPDPTLRARAAVAAGRIRNPKILPALTPLLNDTEIEVVAKAIFALGMIGDSASFEPLKERYSQAGADGKLRIIEALGRIPGIQADNFLRGLLADLDNSLVSEAIRALAWRRDTEALDQITAKLTDADAIVRTWAYYAAYRMADSSYAEKLLPGLNDSLALIRKYSAGAIGRTGSAKYGKELLPLLNDSDYGVKIQAIRACGKCRVKEAADALLKITDSGESRFYREALEALGNIGGENSARELESRLKGEFGDELKYLIPALARIEGERFVPFLETYSDYPSPSIRKAVAEGLANMHGYEANKLKMDFITDVSPAVRCAALQSIAKDKSFKDALIIDALNDKDWTVRVTAAEILAERKNASNYRLIQNCFKKYSPDAGPSEIYSLLQCMFTADKQNTIAEMRNMLDSKQKNLAETARILLKEAGEDIPDKPVPDFAAYVPDFGLPTGKQVVSMMTNKGRIDIELYGEDAPVIADNFLRLVNKSFYKGLEFHRVVGDFVVQGGEPRGDGWGDAGYMVRDQINPNRFESGTVGLPISGYDTGGCQLFICISAQPHLDGRYTAFGKVIKGLETLKDLAEGDRIEDILVKESKPIKYVNI